MHSRRCAQRVDGKHEDLRQQNGLVSDFSRARSSDCDIATHKSLAVTCPRSATLHATGRRGTGGFGKLSNAGELKT